MSDCIILAGGKSFSDKNNLPKALMRLSGKELISHQIDYLKDKVSKIIVSTGSGEFAKKIEEHIYETHPELAIICVNEEKPLGTAGAIKNCIDFVDTPRVLVVNCDDLCDINVKELEKVNKNVICVQPPKLPFGIIHKNSGVTRKLFGEYAFLEKPILKGIFTNCGWYLLEKDTVKKFPLIGSIEYNVFPKLNFNVFHHMGKWNTFNTQKDIEIFEMNNRKF